MDEHILLFIGAVFGFITLIVAVSSAFLRDRQTVKALWTVLLTQVVIMGAVLVPAFLGGWAFAGMMALIGLSALWELLGLYPDIPGVLKVWGMTGGLLIFGGVSFSVEIHPVLFALALVLLVTTIFLKVSKDTFVSVGLVFIATIYTCLFLSQVLYIERMQNGFALIAFLYGISEVNDGFALVFGKLLGRKKIFPELSPNKTYAGCLCGALFACLAAVAFQAAVGIFSFWQAIVGGLVVVSCSLLGDLVASKIKRMVGVKDFGNALPMQGGVLDIYDALIFSSPVFFVYLHFVAKYL